ncbi:hypothetical protein [Streptomyces sp. NPDC101181]|uniref:hypothetical protein n=1 Tax=Streptomyces sp. NPDC101181 TaxID=3366125 RepID=UPI00382B990B
MKTALSGTVPALLFAVGPAAALGSGLVLDGPAKNWSTGGGVVLSLLTGLLLGRREPVKTFLSTRPVLWFLFVFNTAVAFAAPFLVNGPQGVATAIGMGAVALGAYLGLQRERTSRRSPRSSARVSGHVRPTIKSVD